MRNNKIFKISGISLFIIFFMLIFAFPVNSQQGQLFSEEELFEEEDLPYFDKLQDIIYLIDNYYFEEIEKEDLFEKIYRGILEQLDEHSHYLDEEEFEDLQFRHEGEYGGIGISVTITEEDEIVIFNIFEDTPGYKADLKEGDIILLVGFGAGLTWGATVIEWS